MLVVLKILKLFGTAGIRLKYPDEINPSLAYKIGLAIGSLKLSNKSIIVRDSRNTGQILSLSIALGLIAMGIDVYDIGLAPTPVAAYHARKKGGIGISVTASHNPPEYNGFKFYDIEGFEFTRNLERIIEERVDSDIKLNDWRNIGRFREEQGLLEEYIENLLINIGEVRRNWEPYIIIDIGNGSAGHVTPRVLKAIGCKPIVLNANPDGFFPTRPPEPRKDVLETYVNLRIHRDTAAVLAHDGDADRLAAIDYKYGFIKQDRLIALFATEILERRRGVIIVSVDTGRVVDEIAERYGVKIERYALGKTHERVKELGLNNVALAAEPWKLIDPAWGPWVDGVWEAALLTKIIVESGKTLSEVLDERRIREYPWFRVSYLIDPYEKRNVIYENIVEELKVMLGEPDRIIDIDGYRFEYPDESWILVRMSGTEPKIRIYGEALSIDRLREISSTVDKLFLDIVKKNNARIVEKTIG